LCPHHQGKVAGGYEPHVDDFNAHWNIRRGDLTPVDYRLLIQDPEQVIPRGRPQNALTNRSTRRLPSHFEVIDDETSIGLDPTADQSIKEAGWAEAEAEADKANRDNGDGEGEEGEEGEDKEEKDNSAGIGTSN
jgi:hypothetical protein